MLRLLTSVLILVSLDVVMDLTGEKQLLNNHKLCTGAGSEVHGKEGTTNNGH